MLATTLILRPAALFHVGRVCTPANDAAGASTFLQRNTWWAGAVSGRHSWGRAIRQVLGSYRYAWKEGGGWIFLIFDLQRGHDLICWHPSKKYLEEAGNDPYNVCYYLSFPRILLLTTQVGSGWGLSDGLYAAARTTHDSEHDRHTQ